MGEWFVDFYPTFGVKKGKEKGRVPAQATFPLQLSHSAEGKKKGGENRHSTKGMKNTKKKSGSEILYEEGGEKGRKKFHRCGSHSLMSLPRKRRKKKKSHRSDPFKRKSQFSAIPISLKGEGPANEKSRARSGEKRKVVISSDTFLQKGKKKKKPRLATDTFGKTLFACSEGWKRERMGQSFRPTTP